MMERERVKAWLGKTKTYNNGFPYEENRICRWKTNCLSSARRACARLKHWDTSRFGKRFDFTCTIPDVLREYGDKTAEELASRNSRERRRAHPDHSPHGQGRASCTSSRTARGCSSM